eukprot:TRINITY_DN1393_c1_g1_i1.p1 TRINITY_DN1393_c1_g1~~TRINITY_DN1393_c1_g1_i1.p1  ORF type:complete len:505 (+),score=62.10 TRINITY_DN1393_c1_g1_i1:93-1517(+)
MPFGDFLKSAISSVSEIVGSMETGDPVSKVTANILISLPPVDGLLRGRGAEYTAECIRKAAETDKCLLVDLMGGCDQLAVVHNGPVAVFSFNDVSAPPLQMLWSLVSFLHSYLKTPNSKICLLSDSPEEGRVALTVACLLVFSNLFSAEQKAIAWYRGKREFRLTPSQIRYIQYFVSRLAGQRKTFTAPPQVPVKLRLVTLRNIPVHIAQRPNLVLEVHHLRCLYANGDPFSNRAKTFKSVVYGCGNSIVRKGFGGMTFTGRTVTIQVAVSSYVEDDFTILFWSLNEFRRKTILFTAQLHTSFLFDNSSQSSRPGDAVVLTLPLNQLDAAESLGPDFSIELDVIREKEEVPKVQIDGSIVIVSHAERSPLVGPESRDGDEEDIEDEDFSLDQETEVGPNDVASLGASTIARIKSEDLMMSMVHQQSPTHSPRRARIPPVNSNQSMMSLTPNRNVGQAASVPGTASTLFGSCISD